MITRDVGGLRVVHALDYDQYDASCGGLQGATSTALHATGTILDRLALGRGYNSVLLHVGAVGEIGTSTEDTKAAKIGGWLYHSSTTCADDFDRFSTDREKALQPLFVYGNTDTSPETAPGYMATATSTGTGTSGSGAYTVTATDAIQGDYYAPYDISGAGRYLRLDGIFEVAASSSGGSVVAAYGDLIFGAADETPPRTTDTGAGGIGVVHRGVFVDS